jgi:hypothetical protein
MLGFDKYQADLFREFEDFRPFYSGPAYPPYHQGPYLEEYFFYDFLKRGETVNQYFIPVFWTNCYLQNKTAGLQERLNRLDPSREYFCVSQHDDAVKEILPPKTIHFNAGGNKDGIPIPLVCSPLSYVPREKKTFCSFVGSITHPIREKMIQTLNRRTGVEIYAKNWSQEVNKESEKTFIKKTSESIFSLCPRGYGASSFRFYEALQLGAVPVFIYDKPWFPFEDFLDWDKFSIRVHEKDIWRLSDILIETFEKNAFW